MGYALFVAVVLAVSGPGVLGASVPPTELIPGKATHGFSLQMPSEKLPNGDTKFNVRLVVPDGFVLADYRFELSDVTYEVSPDSAKFGAQRIRGLNATQKENIVACVFSVTKKELEDPKLSFSFYKLPTPEDLAHPHLPFTWYALLAKNVR